MGAKKTGPVDYRGRKPSFTRAQLAQVRDLIAASTMNTSQIAEIVGLQRMTVARIRYPDAPF